MSDLKPCPFCGGQAELMTTSFEDKAMYWPQCLNDDCIMSEGGTTWPTQSAAIAAWNRRAEATCTWRNEEEYWEGACGAAWCFIDVGPIENDMHFCPRCGGAITVESGAADE